MTKREKRMLLDLQVIQAATPAPTPTAMQGGGFAPRWRSQDVDLAGLLSALGLISDVELAAIFAQN